MISGALRGQRMIYKVCLVFLVVITALPNTAHSAACSSYDITTPSIFPFVDITSVGTALSLADDASASVSIGTRHTTL